MTAINEMTNNETKTFLNRIGEFKIDIAKNLKLLPLLLITI